jgi:hypothetical protein
MNQVASVKPFVILRDNVSNENKKVLHGEKASFSLPMDPWDSANIKVL